MASRRGQSSCTADASEAGVRLDSLLTQCCASDGELEAASDRSGGMLRRCAPPASICFWPSFHTLCAICDGSHRALDRLFSSHESVWWVRRPTYWDRRKLQTDELG
eukprot:6985677-Prymnesium_polylepis.3